MPELVFPAILIVDHGCQTLTQIENTPQSKDWFGLVAQQHSSLKQRGSHGYPHSVEIRNLATHEDLTDQGLSSYTIISELAIR